MIINLNNYEAFFLDFIEGSLSEELCHELSAFLTIYPELEEELNNYAFVPLVSEDDVFTYKQQLKKFDFETTSIDTPTFEDFCIAYHEKLLSDQKQKQFEQFIGQDERHKELFDSYARVYLKPDLTFRYTFKQRLYRPVKNFYVTRILQIAATMAIMVMLYFMNELVTPNLVQKKHGEAVAGISEKKQNQPGEPGLIVAKKMETGHTAISQFDSVSRVSTGEMAFNRVHKDRNPKRDTIPLQPLIAKTIRNSVYDPEFRLKPSDEPEVICIEEIKETDTPKMIAKQRFFRQFLQNVKKISLSRVSLYTVLSTGMKGINTISPLKINLTADSTGSITSYSFQTGKWKYINYRSNVD